MILTARPIPEWPGPLTPETERLYPRFTATWSSTVRELTTEVGHLVEDQDDAELVLQLAVSESDIRVDGWVKENARPTHPGVVVLFDSRHGPLRYSTDRFTTGTPYTHGRPHHVPGWQANVRAIALALGDLRRVGRYGLGRGDEQYRGWQQLGTGTPMGEGPAPMTAEQAARLLVDGAGLPVTDRRVTGVLTNQATTKSLYRQASKLLHPDRSARRTNS